MMSKTIPFIWSRAARGLLIMLAGLLPAACVGSNTATAQPSAPTREPTPAPVTIPLEESNALLRNPGKGWVLYYPPAEDLPDEIWQAAATCYTRFDWSEVEPAEKQFHPEGIDEGMRICGEHGLQFAFGIMPANTNSENSSVTPDWVFQAGAKYITYQADNGTSLKAPVWNDPVYTRMMQDLISYLAARYDGDARIAYIDARNCGNWGEWHSLGCSELGDEDKAHLVDQWSVFHQTPIIVPTNGDEVEFQARYGVDRYGFGIRRDSAETHPHAAGYAYGHSLAVSEWSGSYQLLKACATWSKICWSDGLVTEYMRDSRFSYDNLGQWGDDPMSFYSEHTDLVREWANRMGYWFKFVDAAVPQGLGNGAPGTITLRVRNDGVAPIYVNHNTSYMRLALLDGNDRVLAVGDPLGGVNLFDWKPGKTTTVSADFYFPQTRGAVYLAVGLFSSASSRNPDIIPGNANLTSDHWLPLRAELK